MEVGNIEEPARNASDARNDQYIIIVEPTQSVPATLESTMQGSRLALREVPRGLSANLLDIS